MAHQLRPCLNFPGTTREAMEFYRAVFGGELTITTFGEFRALPEDSPSADKVMNSLLETEHFSLAAADAIPETPFDVVFGNADSLALVGDAESYDALREAFARLAEGGRVQMELQRQIWGDVYGSLTDRFGKGWMFNITGVEGDGADDRA
ncbi:VOC family protein [Brachybacterium huguangmaarense]